MKSRNLPNLSFILFLKVMLSFFFAMSSKYYPVNKLLYIYI